MEYKPAMRQKCTRTCDMCEPLSPSPPPSPPPSAPPSAPEVNCSGLSDVKKCKIKINKCEKNTKNMKKCKKKCIQDRKKKKPLCQNTCCKLGFTV